VIIWVINDEVAAFSLGEKLNEKLAVIHVEKRPRFEAIFE
jgi:hypothetical protein